jgi:D-proline reductase (dithiol) PrdB
VADPERNLNLHGKAWLAFAVGPQRDRPSLRRLTKPLSESKLALVTTGGFVPLGGEPFNTGKLGDPTFREIPADVEVDTLGIHHPHYDHDLARRDVNVLFPLPLCRWLADEGVIGELAATHYSFMGYVPLTRRLEGKYAPRLSERLRREGVDALLLTPT